MWASWALTAFITLSRPAMVRSASSACLMSMETIGQRRLGYVDACDVHGNTARGLDCPALRLVGPVLPYGVVGHAVDGGRLISFYAGISSEVKPLNNSDQIGSSRRHAAISSRKSSRFDLDEHAHP